MLHALAWTVDYNKDDAFLVKLFELCENHVNTRSDFGKTPLWTAAIQKHVNTVRHLLDKGAETNDISGSGESLLTLCERWNDESGIFDSIIQRLKENDTK